MKATLTPAGYVRVWAVWGGIAVAIFFVCMCLEQGDFGTKGIAWHWPDPAVQDIRYQRVMAAALVGLALAAAGVALQALLRNPLAEPYVLGISSGSAVGVMVWLTLTSGPLYSYIANSQAAQTIFSAGRSVPSVAGALVTCLLVFVIARGGRARAGGSGGGEPVTLLLVGVVISAMNAAILMVINSLSDKGLKTDLASFMLGSISDLYLSSAILNVAAIVIAIAYLPLLFAGAKLNVGSVSDTEAISMGLSIKNLRTLCFVSASLLTGAALMLAGPIGFVGLICPHICRRLEGPDHRKLLVAAPFCGAAFLMAADTAVRITQNLFQTQLPVGVVTALCGGPFFLFLLLRRRN